MPSSASSRLPSDSLEMARRPFRGTGSGEDAASAGSTSIQSPGYVWGCRVPPRAGTSGLGNTQAHEVLCLSRGTCAWPLRPALPGPALPTTLPPRHLPAGVLIQDGSVRTQTEALGAGDLEPAQLLCSRLAPLCELRRCAGGGAPGTPGAGKEAEPFPVLNCFPNRP